IWHRLHMQWLRGQRGDAPELTVHLQNISRRHLSRPGKHWLIPNLEWLRNELEFLLPSMDRILCKTQDAVEQLRHRHAGVLYTGFSSTRLPERISGDLRYDQVLHVAGNNRKKGTEVLLDLWRRHPEWPMLHLVIDWHRRPAQCPANITVHTQLNDGELLRLRSESGFVLAPSEAEGFGHVLIEGMAWGGIVVTVDAPPMNELVGSDRGVCVPWNRSTPCRLGCQYFVDAFLLESALDQLFARDQDWLEERAARAHQWVRENHQRFRQDFQQLLKKDLSLS
ncbi:MAG: glycosyltransferase, partial [Oleiphilaceae bacterium]|nr:glycosyltransferase [Oleiphilaceae bacterium]